jgi:hypothetical protein
MAQGVLTGKYLPDNSHPLVLERPEVRGLR